jgi:hypothetical protein
VRVVVVQGCGAMPNVVDVRDHWIELYSADPEVTATADYLFWFGYKSPPNILVTTCLSALTLGVSVDRHLVGTVGVRVHRYVWLTKTGGIRYKELPPSHDWNSERISRCVSVEVRNSVFYANATSLSTVYVFETPSSLIDWTYVDWAKRRVISFERNSGKLAHSVDVVGPADGLDEQWSDIERHVSTTAAGVTGIDVGQLASLVTSTEGFAGSGRVDPDRRRLVRPRRIALGGPAAAIAGVTAV